MKDMFSYGPDAFDDPAQDEWERFREGEGDFIGLAELKGLDLGAMPEDVRIPPKRRLGRIVVE